MKNDTLQPHLLAFAALFLHVLLSPASAALALRSKSRSVTQGTGHLSTAPFGSDCKKDKECVSEHCYDGKCAYSGNCKKRDELCYTYAAHTCCAGSCQAVTMIDDCKRLLQMSGSPAMKGGLSVTRQCANLGVCQSFPGTVQGPSRLSTPWAVPADDMARKYFTRAELTFAEGVAVRTDLFAARRMGQTYLNVSPDQVNPGGVRDAGVVIFTDDSKVELRMGASFSDGKVTYCAAPITRNGAGGGFFAVGHDCCNNKNGFHCDDAAVQMAGHRVTSGLVVTSDYEKYMQVVQMIEGVHGYKYHDDKKGVKSPIPIFVRILKDYAKEFSSPQPGFMYQPPAKITHCVAPIMAVGKPTMKDVEFWAVGTDCCSLQEGFHCGAVDAASARSGKQLKDASGMFRNAVTMSEIRNGLHAPGSPLYVKWTAETLVPTPPAMKL